MQETSPKELTARLDALHIRALIFDLDGVITQTATVHASAWKKMFDAYLLQRGKQDGTSYAPLNISTDYPQYIDGIPRYDGVRNFLRSRNIVLPEGSPEDMPGTETVAGLGNQKNTYFRKVLEQEGIAAFPDAVAFIQQQHKAGRRTAIISASKNCRAILQAANLEHYFEVRVDGEVSVELNLKGKPAPDIFLEAARQLGVKPSEAAIFEDARAGVAAGKAGKFALVVGINRHDAPETEALLQNGADLVVTTLSAEKPEPENDK